MDNPSDNYIFAAFDVYAAIRYQFQQLWSWFAVDAISVTLYPTLCNEMGSLLRFVMENHGNRSTNRLYQDRGTAT